MQRFFPAQPQCCLTFLKTGFQMLLIFRLLHVDMILPRYAIFYIFVSMSIFISNSILGVHVDFCRQLSCAKRVMEKFSFSEIKT